MVLRRLGERAVVLPELSTWPATSIWKLHVGAFVVRVYCQIVPDHLSFDTLSPVYFLALVGSPLPFSFNVSMSGMGIHGAALSVPLCHSRSMCR